MASSNQVRPTCNNSGTATATSSITDTLSIPQPQLISGGTRTVRLPTRQSSPAASRYITPLSLFKDISTIGNDIREKPPQSQILAQFYESLNGAIVAVHTSLEDRVHFMLKALHQLFQYDAGWVVYWDSGLLSLTSIADQMLTSVDTPDPNADAEAIAGLGLYLDGASDGGPSDRPAFSQFTTDTTESIAEAGGVGGEGKDKIPGTNIVTEEMEAEGTANDDSEEFGLANPAKEGIRIIQIYGGTSDTPLRRADLIQSFLKVYQFVTSAEPTLIEYLHVTTQTATLCIPFSRNGQPFAALCLKTKLSPTSISRILNTASPLPATASPNTRPQFFVYRHSAHTLLSLLGGRNGSSMSGAYNNASVSTVSSMDTPTMSQTNSPRSYYIGESMMTNSGSYCLQYAASCAAHIIERYRHEIHAKNEVARALIVNRMFKAINSHMEPEQIIAATAKTICRAFKADRCMIIHFSQPDSSEQHPLGYITKVVAEYRSNDSIPITLNQEFDMTTYIPVKRTPMKTEAYTYGPRSPNSLISNDSLHDPKFLHIIDFLHQFHIRSSMNIRTKNPASEYNGLIGVHQCSYARAFTSADIALLEVLGAHIGEALSLQAQQYNSNQVIIQNKEAEAAQQKEIEFAEKTMLFSNVVHELRTPLNGVLGFVDLLKETELTSIQREHCQDIRNGGEMLLRLVNQILDLSKVQSNTMDFQLVNCSARGIIDETLRLLSPMARQKSLELVPLVAIDCPDVILTDDFRVRQILGNLISNSIKFSPKHSLIVIRVVVAKSAIHSDTVMGDYHDQTSNETNRAGSQVFKSNTTQQRPFESSQYCVGKPIILEFSVEDHGLGIPSEAQPLLFRRFMQLSDSHHRTSGSGLGLAICKELALNMGGDVWLDSSVPNKGSTFKFTVNVAELERIDDGSVVSPFVSSTGVIPVTTPTIASPMRLERPASALMHHSHGMYPFTQLEDELVGIVVKHTEVAEMIKEQLRGWKFADIHVFIVPPKEQILPFEDQLHLYVCNIVISDLTTEQILCECFGKSSKEVHTKLAEHVIWFVPSDYKEAPTGSTITTPSSAPSSLSSSLDIFAQSSASQSTNITATVQRKMFTTGQDHYALTSRPNIDVDSYGCSLFLLPIGSNQSDHPIFNIDVLTNTEWTTMEIVKPVRQHDITKQLLNWIRIVQLHRQLQETRISKKKEHKRLFSDSYDDDNNSDGNCSSSKSIDQIQMPIAPVPVAHYSSNYVHASGSNSNSSHIIDDVQSISYHDTTPMQDVVSDIKDNNSNKDSNDNEQQQRQHRRGKRLKTNSEEANLINQSLQQNEKRDLQTILVVEDNPLNAKLMCRMIEGLGYQTEHATNGEDAYNLALEKNYNLIFMDYQLPGMDGFQSAAKIRQRERLGGRPRVPIIALTGMSGDRIRERCFENGIDDYLTKPVAKHTLYDLLQQWCLKK